MSTVFESVIVIRTVFESVIVIRKLLLVPPEPNRRCTLCGTRQGLMNTCMFRCMALDRKVQAPGSLNQQRIEKLLVVSDIWVGSWAPLVRTEYNEYWASKLGQQFAGRCTNNQTKIILLQESIYEHRKYTMLSVHFFSSCQQATFAAGWSHGGVSVIDKHRSDGCCL